MPTRNVLVAGGAGYIGSHTAKALARAGFVPVVLDNLSSGHKHNVCWGPLVEGNISDRAIVADTIRRYDIQAVIHLAAFAYVGESVIHPRKYYANNVSASIALLDTMIDCGVKKLVFSSSCATYGLPRFKRIREDHPQCPISPYGETKLVIERACRYYQTAYGLQTMCLRYFNAAGADPDGELGEDHTPETHLIPLAIRAVLDPTAVLNVYGTEFETPDGTAVRDFVHVSDIASAHVLSLRYLFDNEVGVNLNLGTGSGHSVGQIIKMTEDIAGRKLHSAKHAARPGDPPCLVASASLAKAQLGWTPKESSMQMILSSALRWHARQLSATYPHQAMHAVQAASEKALTPRSVSPQAAKIATTRDFDIALRPDTGRPECASSGSSSC